ncbi:phenylhydantoinase [Mesobacillus campisalis]|uniref:Phenylhydantoinase n=1 Tax=Mesobacillus campisalis TaxID=1408103 RepID=A0A0M2SZI5_9BACI|nr:dihydropyrimidinase [Mesobacillus campisalis]KKK39974.1 phenylhydantoinase [Mesobacillus campisalis]
MKTIIKNGIVVTSGSIFKADILIEGESITSISSHITQESADKIINAEGQYVFPGGIDVHTHLEWPLMDTETADDFVSGTKAAAVGGITSIINFTKPEIGASLIPTQEEWIEKGKKSVIDYGLHAIINHYSDRVLEELPILAETYGVGSIKLFMAYKGEMMVNDLEMYKIMKKAGELGIITNVHAENGDIIDEMIAQALAEGKTDPIYHGYTRPTIMEAEATGRALAIAEAANAPIYIVHVSCAEALEKVVEAKKRGVQAFAETCPQYLVLDISYLDQPNFEGGKYVCSPPLREKWNQDALWNGLQTGIISVAGSDHCPFRYEGQKTMGKDDFSKIPNGLPGLEDIFSILYHFGVHKGRISLNKFVEIISTNPAKLFGLTKKGDISIGKDADIVVFDPNRSRVITAECQYQNVDYNAYEGMKVQGVITNVLSRGEVIVKDGQFIGDLARGKYLHRSRVQNQESMANLQKDGQFREPVK